MYTVGQTRMRLQRQDQVAAVFPPVKTALEGTAQDQDTIPHRAK